jgi:hypothetical protein
MRLFKTHGSFLEAQKYEFILRIYLAAGMFSNFTNVLLTRLSVCR